MMVENFVGILKRRFRDSGRAIACGEAVPSERMP
jgi:hypothetical protein